VAQVPPPEQATAHAPRQVGVVEVDERRGSDDAGDDAKPRCVGGDQLLRCAFPRCRGRVSAGLRASGVRSFSRSHACAGAEGPPGC